MSFFYFYDTIVFVPLAYNLQTLCAIDSRVYFTSNKFNQQSLINYSVYFVQLVASGETRVLGL